MKMAVLRSASSLPALPDSARYHGGRPGWVGQAGEEVMGLPQGREEERLGLPVRDASRTTPRVRPGQPRGIAISLNIQGYV